MRRFNFLLACAIVCSLSSTSFAQEKKTSWWNPLSYGKSDSASEKDSNGFVQLPELSMPTWSSPSKKSGPSTMEKIGSSSKKMWDNTLDFMNPFNDAEDKSEKAPSYLSYSRTTPKPKKKGWFSWLWVEEEIEHPATVNDFLSRDRPSW